jgi:hypothetical protein
MLTYKFTKHARLSEAAGIHAMTGFKGVKDEEANVQLLTGHEKLCTAFNLSRRGLSYHSIPLLEVGLP